MAGQYYLPAPWVRARVLALYQAVFNGGMGLGAIFWGALGEHAGLPGTIFAAGLGGGVIALLTRAVQLPAEIGDPSAPAISVPRALSISEEKESFGAPVRRNRSCGLDIENEGGGARVTVFDAADRPPALFAAWQPMRILLIENDPVVCAEHHANA